MERCVHSTAGAHKVRTKNKCVSHGVYVYMAYVRDVYKVHGDARAETGMCLERLYAEYIKRCMP